jgi:hypothetical protein
MDLKDTARATPVTDTLMSAGCNDPGNHIQKIDRRRKQFHAPATSRGAMLIAPTAVIDQKPTIGRKRRPRNP